MSEHFPKSTLTATGWCLKCHRNTEHQVDDGRLGRCLDEAHPAPPLPRAEIPKLDLSTECEISGKGRSHDKKVQPAQKDLFEK